MEQVLLAYSFPKENITAIMMLYKNMEAMVHLPDDDTDFIDIVPGVYINSCSFVEDDIKTLEI